MVIHFKLKTDLSLLEAVGYGIVNLKNITIEQLSSLRLTEKEKILIMEKSVDFGSEDRAQQFFKWTQDQITKKELENEASLKTSKINFLHFTGSISKYTALISVITGSLILVHSYKDHWFWKKVCPKFIFEFTENNEDNLTTAAVVFSVVSVFSGVFYCCDRFNIEF